jgi:hypothetical protein
MLLPVLAVVDLKVQDALTVTGVLTGASLDISGDIDIDGTANLDIVDIDGAVNMATTALVTGVLTTTATQVATGGITSGSDIISDTDSTDSLGSTGVRWLKGWFDTLTAGTLTVGSGSVTDSSGAISFGNENLTTTGIVTAAGTSVFTNLDISGDIDVDGTTNLDVVDIDGAVDMASTALVTGVLTTTAATVFNGGFASNAASTISLADNGTQLTLISTDADAAVGPVLDLFRNSASPANFDIIGKIVFSGEDNGGNKTDYVHQVAYPQTVTGGSEQGYWELHTLVGGTDRVRIDASATEVSINNIGIDSDFRVESDTQTHALFVEGSSGNVGIGTTSPSYSFVISDGGNIGFEFSPDDQNTGVNRIYSYDRGTSAYKDLKISASQILFGYGSSGGNEAMRIDSSGNVLVGKTAANTSVAGVEARGDGLLVATRAWWSTSFN